MILSPANYLENKGGKFGKGLFYKFILFSNDLDQSREQYIWSINGELHGLIAEAGLTWTDETLFAIKKAVNITLPRTDMIFSHIPLCSDKLALPPRRLYESPDNPAHIFHQSSSL